LTVKKDIGNLAKEAVQLIEEEGEKYKWKKEKTLR